MNPNDYALGNSSYLAPQGHPHGPSMGLNPIRHGTQPSLQGTTEVVLTESRRLTERLIVLVARLDGAPCAQADSPPKGPQSMLMQLAEAHNYLAVCDKALAELEGKIFG